MNTLLLTELTASPLALCREGFAAVHGLRAEAEKDLTFTLTDGIYMVQNGVALIRISGVMTKHDSWYQSGTTTLASYVSEALRDAAVEQVVLIMDTPGGTVDSIEPLELALSGRQKQVLALVSGMCASAGYYIASLCDYIAVASPISRVGSIGVMATIVDDSEALKQAGYRLVEIYPPESEDKNRDVREALDGKTERYIEHVLSPLARHFQQTVRTHREGLREETPGVLSGAMFYAQEALEAGLIDRIML